MSEKVRALEVGLRVLVYQREGKQEEGDAAGERKG